MAPASCIGNALFFAAAASSNEWIRDTRSEMPATCEGVRGRACRSAAFANALAAQNRSQARRGWQTVGRSPFARKDAYYRGGAYLSQRHRRAYFSEGYLLLRSLLPPATVAAIGDELRRLRSHGWEDSPNAWMRSDHFLDFLIFGPFGHVASQLAGGGPIHLVRTTHHFRDGVSKLQPTYHFDWGECEDGYPPASDTSRALVKFYIAMNDNMPALWLLNQSSFEAFLRGPTDDDTVLEFRAGRLSPPHNLCDRQSLGCSGPTLPAEFVNGRALRPILQLGDAIVHATTVVHRSPEAAAEGDGGGFVTLTYGTPDTKYTGQRVGQTSECASGLVSGEHPPRLADLPQPGCAPRVYPLEAVWRAYGMSSRVSYRRY
eukprot:gnl/TRDRNA2_/TRDRNA2_71608_c0_seq2.p1 gnl/TRDRNA2_/TRDRNA2_71608_c0~~gnl/TRDRNA2_/TRDRNA2_71608_c0_seq2.p1  ORF type:complete len:374 (-),score=53.61 gnl/TRDRNA2_/TRDRNA2_71608_c0_seq2:22-1143(-)